MLLYRLARSLVGLALTAIVAAVAWFTVGHGVLDKINESNARAGGGGPLNQRIVSARRFTPIVAGLRQAVGSEAQLVAVTLRPDSVEFEVVQRGRARGYRWRDGQDGLETYDVGTTGQAGQPSNRPWRMSLLDTRAPERITRAISAAENGDFHLSIGDIQRADTGKLIWIMRGTIGERGVAYYAPPGGSRIKPYDPSKPGALEGRGARRLHPARAQRRGEGAALRRALRALDGAHTGGGTLSRLGVLAPAGWTKRSKVTVPPAGSAMSLRRYSVTRCARRAQVRVAVVRAVVHRGSTGSSPAPRSRRGRRRAS